MSKLLFALLIVVSTVSVSARVAVKFAPINNGTAPELAGFVTQDIQVLTTDDWSSSGMYLNLTAGSIYQAVGGFDTPPTSVLGQAFPAIAFDTYVGIVDESLTGIAGAAGDLNGASPGWPHQFDTQGLNVTWFNIPGFSDSGVDFGISTIGRLSLSDDAQGTLAFSISEVDKKLVQYEFPIIDGRVIPDPCSGLGGDVGCDLIGIDDLNNVLSNWNQSVGSGNFAQGDYNHDSFVGIDDLGAILSFWNLETRQDTEPLVITNPIDQDGDGFVGINDLNIVLGNWNATVPPADPLGDHDGNGFIGQDDLNAVLSAWNAGTPPGGPVPEPASLALLGVALSLCVYGRAHRARHLL